MTAGDRIGRFDSVPINRHLGFTLVSRSPEESVVTMPLRPEFIQEGGVVHGGVLSALADTAAVYTFWPYLSEERSMTSIEFKVNFLSPVRPGGGDLTARARVIRRGRTIGVCDVEVSQHEKPVVKGLFTYIFFDRHG